MYVGDDWFKRRLRSLWRSLCSRPLWIQKPLSGSRDFFSGEKAMNGQMGEGGGLRRGETGVKEGIEGESSGSFLILGRGDCRAPFDNSFDTDIGCVCAILIGRLVWQNPFPPPPPYCYLFIIRGKDVKEKVYHQEVADSSSTFSASSSFLSPLFSSLISLVFGSPPS